jgi:hypothetical protein
MSHFFLKKTLETVPRIFENLVLAERESIKRIVQVAMAIISYHTNRIVLHQNQIKKNAIATTRLSRSDNT